MMQEAIDVIEKARKQAEDDYWQALWAELLFLAKQLIEAGWIEVKHKAGGEVDGYDMSIDLQDESITYHYRAPVPEGVDNPGPNFAVYTRLDAPIHVVKEANNVLRNALYNHHEGKLEHIRLAQQAVRAVQ